ncbi:MAG TPA: SWIM zinc finger family protein [Pseudonocardiaceae bacterium]|nr:SWIM zinc finger family protein [Pseudonocardiaceae bacterium]
MTEPKDNPRIPRAAWSSGARKVDGGIRAVSRRGEIGQSWWSRRFLEVLESFGMGGRLLRGKNYARAGQVLSMNLSTSLVVAQVQGSRPEPYRVRIAVKAFTDREWLRIEEALAAQALFAAKLLAGEMPADIEDVFTQLGLKLFPGTLRELSMDCSCPDWEVPCKHLAATCYLLAESFDADPFEILAWRGRSRTELLARLRRLRDGGHRPVEPIDAEPDTARLDEAIAEFWLPGPQPDQPVGEPPVLRPDALLDQLDPTGLTVGGRELTDLLRPAYKALNRQNGQEIGGR